MPAPTNLSAATAIELGPLPNTITQNVNDSGTTYTVWYKYTKQPADNVIGIWAFGDLLAYTASMNVYDSDGVTILAMAHPFNNVPCRFPVSLASGGVIYFQVASLGGNVGTANLVIDGRPAPALPVPVGSLLVPEDAPGFGTTALSAVDGSTLIYYVPSAVGETGGVLDDGSAIVLLNDDANGGDPDALKPFVYDSTFTFLRIVNQQYDWVTCNGTNFYGLEDADGQTIQLFTGAGALGATWNLGAFVSAFAVSKDGTIAYYTLSARTSIKRWDLVNNVALSDLYTFSAGYTAVSTCEILVLADGSLIVGVAQVSVPDYQYLHLSAAGTLLATYDQGSVKINKLGSPALDDPVSFWAWMLPNGGSDFGTSRYSRIRVADGTVLATFDVPQFEGGQYMLPATATPTRFGPSESCPLLILRAAIRGVAGCPVGLPLSPSSTSPGCAVSVPVG